MNTFNIEAAGVMAYMTNQLKKMEQTLEQQILIEEIFIRTAKDILQRDTSNKPELRRELHIREQNVKTFKKLLAEMPPYMEDDLPTYEGVDVYV